MTCTPSPTYFWSIVIVTAIVCALFGVVIIRFRDVIRARKGPGA